MRTCRDCGQELPIDESSPSEKNRDGRTSYGRACCRVRERDDATRPSRCLPSSEFGRRTGERTGRVAYCQPCCNRKKVESRERQHGGSRNHHLKHRYGITVEDDDRMLAEQGALCRERPAEHVDHDHLTGRVRGLLCSCCNQGLGNRDRADVLRLAVAHLQTTTWQKERLEPGGYRLHPPQAS